MHIIFGNYGNNTIALIQWCYENKLKNIQVVHIETGWAAPTWTKRVKRAQQLVKKCGFVPVTLYAKNTFTELVIDRNGFPSPKFQWCVPFLKGLPLLQWLDEMDIQCTATILLGSRRADSRARATLPEFIQDSEHYNERKVWYPLFDCGDATRDALIERARIEKLPHRSLECDPCIHSTCADLARLDKTSIQRTVELENRLQKTLFSAEKFAGAEGIEQVVGRAKQQHKASVDDNLELFDMSCGAPYGCGE